MSKTLGPIHYNMYEKIKFQDVITSFLMDGQTEIIDKKIPPVSNEPLEKIIDQDNIHGYLASKIDIVENRLSMALNLSEDPEKKLYNLGQKMSDNKNFNSYEEVFSDLNMYLLDGMPCDNGLSAMMEKDELYLVTNVNLHKKYDSFIDPKDSLDNTCEGGHDHDHHESFEIKDDENIEMKKEESTYHQYRYEFLKGYFSNTNYGVDLVDGINYKIYKK